MKDTSPLIKATNFKCEHEVEMMVTEDGGGTKTLSHV